MLAALDVAIGLVLVYLLLSLFATSIGETVSQVLRLRERNLERAVTRLLGDSAELAKDFYESPRIRSLWNRSRKPSYLAPEAFAEVVIELVAGPGGADLSAAKRGDAIAGFGWGRWRSENETETGDTRSLARGRLARVMIAFSEQAGDDGAAMRAAVVKWFDAAMERTAGSYRRVMQNVLLGVGVVLALLADADTIRISTVLFDEPSLRAAFVEAATAGVAPATEDLGPVLGWTRTEMTRGFSAYWWAWWPAKLCGILLTGIAVRLGSPFWFNALQGLLQIRASLRPGDAKPAPGAVAAAAISATPSGTATAPTAAVVLPAPPETVFEPSSVAYTRGNAWMFAVVSQAAYLDENGFKAALPTSLGPWGTRPISHVETDTQVFVASSERAVLVAFRGTETLRDALTDVQYELSPSQRMAMRNDGPTERGSDSSRRMVDANPAADSGSGTERVHPGFAKAVDAVWKDLEAVLAAATDGKTPAIHFCGHSLGGALAVLAADRWRKSAAGRRVAGVYTYGQPRCVDSDFASRLDRQLGERIYRHVNHRDAVPRLPPRSFGYQHTGRCIYFDCYGRLHDSPATWFQVLDTVRITRESMSNQMRETLSDHRAQEYVGLTRAQLG